MNFRLDQAIQSLEEAERPARLKADEYREIMNDVNQECRKALQKVVEHYATLAQGIEDCLSVRRTEQQKDRA